MSSRRHRTALLVAALAATGALTTPDVSSAQPGPEASAQSPPSSPPPPASPQEIAIARQTALEGLSAYRSGDFEKALTLFQQAKAVYPSAQILRMEGYSLLALEKWEQAAASMEASLVSEVGPLSADDRKDVADQLAKALSHLGTISVSSTVPGAQLRLNDGEPLSLPLNKPIRLLAGKHKLVVSAPEHDDVLEEVELEGGKEVERALDPVPKKKEEEKKPPPPPPPAPPAKKGWFPMQREIGIAAAGAGIAFGGATLITALAGAHIRGNVEDDVARHKASFGESCDKGDYRLCAFDRAVINHDADRADGLRDASVGLGIAAGVLVAGGVVLFLFAGDGQAKEEAKVGLVEARGRASLPGARRVEAAETKGSVACGPSVAPGFACVGTF